MNFKRTIILGGLLTMCIASADFYSGQWIKGKDGWLFPVDEFRFYTSERPETISDSLETISALNKLFTAKNIDLYTSIIPIRARIYNDKLPEKVVLPDTIKKRYENAMQALTASGVKVVDLNTSFIQAPDRIAEYPLYLKGDHHWSAPAGLLAAQLLADMIKKSNKVQSDDTVKATIVRGQPTLSPKTPITPDGEAPGTLQTEKYIPINVDLQGESLLGDEYFPITVVGDSFSNGERDGVGLFAYPSLIEAKTNRRVYNAAQPGKGPWIPMLDYLKSNIYQSSPPKIINWEMWETYLVGDGSGYLPDYFLKFASMLIAGDCNNAAILQSAKSFDIDLGDYIIVSNMDAGDKLYGSVDGESGNSAVMFNERISIDSPSQHGQAYIFPSTFTNIKNMYIKTKSGNIKQPENLKICKLPINVIDTLSIDGKTLDYAKRNFRNQLDTSGFYETNDLLSSRWALGGSTEIKFLAKTSSIGKLILHGFNPFKGQKISIMFNSSKIGEINLDMGYFDFSADLKDYKGENSLRFEFSKYKDADEETKAVIHDSRNLAVNFDTFQISKP